MKIIFTLLIVFTQFIVLSQRNYTSGMAAYSQEKYNEALVKLSSLTPSEVADLKEKNKPKFYLARVKSFNNYKPSSGDNKLMDYFEQAYQDLLTLKKLELNKSQEDDFTNAKNTFKYKQLILGVNLSNSAYQSPDKKEILTQANDFLIKNNKLEENYSATSILATNYLSLGDTALAYKNFEKAIILYPKDHKDNPDINVGYDYYRKALIERYQMNNLDLAIATIERGIETVNSEFNKLQFGFPDKRDAVVADLNNFLLDIYMNFPDKKEEALKKFEKAVADEPKNYVKHIAYAQLLEDVDPKKAIKMYEKAIEIDKNQLVAHFNLGALYYNMGYQASIKMNQIDDFDSDEYEKLNKEFKNYMTIAKSHFENGYAVNPNDLSTVKTLKQICISIDDMEGYKKYKEALEKLLNN